MSSARLVQFDDDYRELLSEFAHAGVDFLLIGGWAMALHGHGRGTDDIDLLVRPSTENSRLVVGALTAFGAPVAAHGIGADYFSKPGPCYRLGRKPLLVEVLTQVSGINYDEAIADVRYFELEKLKIPYIGRAALIANKQAAGRLKDLADVEWLEKHPDE